VVGINASGQVRELQLRIRITFQLTTAQGKTLIESDQILQQRDISYSESAALAKETEEGLLYRDMQTDLVVAGQLDADRKTVVCPWWFNGVSGAATATWHLAAHL